VLHLGVRTRAPFHLVVDVVLAERRETVSAVANECIGSVDVVGLELGSGHGGKEEESCDPVLAVHPSLGLLHEGPDLVARALLVVARVVVARVLGNHDGLVELLVGRHGVLEVADGGGVDVDGSKVPLATPVAGVDKLGEPGGTGGGSRGEELVAFVMERGEVSLPHLGTGGRREVGLARNIRLVHACSILCVALDDLGLEGRLVLGTPEHGDEVHAVGHHTVLEALGPIVDPADFAGLELGDEVRLVVRPGEPDLAARSAGGGGDADADSRGRGGLGRGRLGIVVRLGACRRV